MSPDGDSRFRKGLGYWINRAGFLSGPFFDCAKIMAFLDYKRVKFSTLFHKTAVALFSEKSVNGTNSGAKVFATKYLPKLKMYLQMFQGTEKNKCSRRSRFIPGAVCQKNC